MIFIYLHMWTSIFKRVSITLNSRRPQNAYILWKRSSAFLHPPPLSYQPDFPTHDHCSPNPLPPDPHLSAEWDSRSWSLHWNPTSLPHARASWTLSSRILLNSCWLPCTAARKCKPADWQWPAPASCIDKTLLKCKARYTVEKFSWKKDSLNTQINMVELRTRVLLICIKKV